MWPGTNEAHKLAKICTNKNRRKVNLLKNGHKYSYNPQNIKTHSEKSLRSNREILLLTERSNCTAYEKSSKTRSMKLWNKLPEEIKKIRDFDMFKVKNQKGNATEQYKSSRIGSIK